MAKEIKLVKREESYEDKETKERVEYTQLYIVIDNVKVKVRPTYKTDKKILVALAQDYEEINNRD